MAELGAEDASKLDSAALADSVDAACCLSLVGAAPAFVFFARFSFAFSSLQGAQRVISLASDGSTSAEQMLHFRTTEEEAEEVEEEEEAEVGGVEEEAAS